MAWTEARIETMRQAWTEGLSASQIAKMLGGVTRNAVIGKVHRLGLPRRITPDATTAGATDRTRRTRARARAKAPARPPTVPVKHVLSLERQMLATLPALGPELQHAERGCRYIPTDPALDTHTCGRAAIDGPWCALHRRLVYQPQSPKARVRSPERDEMRRQLKHAMAAAL